MRTKCSREKLAALLLASGLLLSAPGCQTTSMGWGWPKTPSLTTWNPWKSTTPPSTALATKPPTTPPSTHATPSPTGSVALAQSNTPGASAYANQTKPPIGTPTAYPTTYPTTTQPSATPYSYPAQPAAYQSQGPVAGPAGAYPASAYPQSGYPNAGYPATPAATPSGPGYQTGPYNTGAGAQAPGQQYPASYPPPTAAPSYQGGYNPPGGYQGTQPAVVGENGGDAYGTPPASPRGGAYGGGSYSGASNERRTDEPAASVAAASSNVPAAMPSSTTANAIGPGLPSALSNVSSGYRPGSTGRAHAAGEVQQTAYEQPAGYRR